MSTVRGKRLGNRRAALWWLGWHPIITPLIGGVGGLTVGNAIAVPMGLLFGLDVLLTMGAGAVVGALAGVGVWYRGTKTVNREYGDVAASVAPGGDDAADATPSFVLLGQGAGTRPLVEPNRRYDASVVRLGADVMDVRRGSFDFADRRVTFGREAVSLPYEFVRTVTYDGSALAIETTRGDRFTADATTEPTDLLCALRDRIRD